MLRDPFAVINGQTGIDFPGGKYRWGESLENELKREVKEETNLEIEIGQPFFVWTNKDLKRKIKSHPVVYVGFICKYKLGNVKLSGEHTEFEWVDSTTYKKWQDNTEDFKALKEYFRITGNKGT